jgi:dihydrolipoamide dehydrogenase
MPSRPFATRSLCLARDEGLTRRLFEVGTDRVIGCCVVGPSAGDLISEVALAIEMRADAADIAHTIHPHPTLSETVGMAAAPRRPACRTGE